MGARHPLLPVDVAWRIQPRKRFSLRRQDRSPEQAQIYDISVTGAAVWAPASDDIMRGSLVTMRFEDVEGEVAVRRIDPHPSGVLAIYGIEYPTDSPLGQRLHDKLLTAVIDPLPPPLG